MTAQVAIQDFTSFTFDNFLKNAHRCQKETDKKLITKAFKLIRQVHGNAQCPNGESCVIYSLKVAEIVNKEIGLGTKSIVCTLLQNVLNDTEYTLEDIKNMFGEKIAFIINGLNKIRAIDYEQAGEAEVFREILLSLSDDIRVILIKFAERLHSLRTLSALPQQKQIKLAKETLEIYAPLSHRLGMNKIKTEFENLSFKAMYPADYQMIDKQMKEGEKSHIGFINTFSLPIINELSRQGFKYDIKSRIKSHYSIWQKMQRKQVSFDEVYDRLAIRLVFEPKTNESEIAQCWHIFSIVTRFYAPKSDRLRDWLTHPKSNGYSALHTTVMGKSGRWVEVQIRSKRMDEVAEIGFAAHWKYKGVSSRKQQFDEQIRKIKQQLLDPTIKATEFLDNFKMDLFSSEVQVFTPSGEIVSLPRNSTVLDFAFAIHTDLAFKCIGAKINQKIVAIDHVLSSGDQIEVLTAAKQKPKEEWLNLVSSGRAKNALKRAFKKQTNTLIEEGNKLLDKHLREINETFNNRIFQKFVQLYHVKTKKELLLKIGKKELNETDITKALQKKSPNKLLRYWKLRLGKSVSFEPKKRAKTSFHFANFDKDIDYKIATCCAPIPGDKIVGILKNNDTLVVHKGDCSRLLKESEKIDNQIVKIEWKQQKKRSYLTQIKIAGLNKRGIIGKITSKISDELNVQMRAINMESRNGQIDGKIELYIYDAKHLENLVSDIKKINGIKAVHRITSVA